MLLGLWIRSVDGEEQLDAWGNLGGSALITTCAGESGVRWVGAKTCNPVLRGPDNFTQKSCEECMLIRVRPTDRQTEKVTDRLKITGQECEKCSLIVRPSVSPGQVSCGEVWSGRLSTGCFWEAQC